MKGIRYTHIRQVYFGYDGEILGESTVSFDINEVGDHPDSADSSIKLLEAMAKSACPPEANPISTHTLFLVLE